LQKGKKVIDLSADYRFQDTDLYAKYYKVAHKDPKNLPLAVYGLPELFHAEIAQAALIANPGCYPTSIILGLFPLLKEGLIAEKVIINSCSAITGAGRKAVIDYHYSNIANNIWAYKPFLHQHTPEITEILKIKTSAMIKPYFIPHVAGVEAGIYSTMFVSFRKKANHEQLQALYRQTYQHCPFIRLRTEGLPRLKDSVGTNFCDIGFSLSPEADAAVIVSSIDNLIKGAAGQAVQNMNIMLNLPETTGLL
ncbi:MAG: N-acetyl-gamma-glutamyl-phosphate reductase, partial [Candidatus Omnitrophica bacterium]|nr:N-acetyl-gamma-glutamyl-phosphate reductase [Candidatus Omnitrophota bacterium]